MRILGSVIVSILLLPSAVSAPTHEPRAEDKRLKIVAFGTSLTARGGWPKYLERALTKCLRRPVAVATVAESGATSDWGVDAIDRVILEAPHIVLIEFYANDAALHRVVSLDRSRKNLMRIIDELLKHLPQSQIFVMAMNPIRGTRRLVRPFLESYIEAHRDVALKRGVEFVDHRPAWRRFSKNQLTAAIPDGSHPLPETAATVMIPTLMTEIAAGKCCEQRQNLDAGTRLCFR